MRLALELLVALAALAGPAVFAGAETAFYRVSRVRLEMEARAGRRRARVVAKLLSDETALVVVLVLGVNLCVEILTWRAGAFLRDHGLAELEIEIALTLLLTPFVFFWGELVPKDLFRRRPHAALRTCAPVISGLWILFWPLVFALAGIARGVAKLLGFEARLFGAVQGREAVLGYLAEGRKSGALPQHAEQMARNVLKLRTIPIERCMVAWKDVACLDARAPAAEQYAAVARSGHTRILVRDGGTVVGYVHQLDVLSAGEAVPLAEHLRPVPELAPDLSVDRALGRLRAGGQRLALVGTRDAPRGVVTLKDLVEEISGDLPRW